MEFKGTKGKWVLDYNREEYPNMLKVCTEDGNKVFDFGDDTQYYPSPGMEPNEYNALLISKAPEMLEILNEVYEAMVVAEANDKHLRKRVLELIKQATTL